MKRKLIVGCLVAAVIGAVVALAPRAPSNSTNVSASFLGYTNDDDYAVFRISNLSTNQLLCGAGEIQLKKGKAWVADTNRLRHVGAPILESGASINLFVPVRRMTNIWRCRIFITDLTEMRKRPAWHSLVIAIWNTFLGRQDRIPRYEVMSPVIRNPGA